MQRFIIRYVMLIAICAAAYGSGSAQTPPYEFDGLIRDTSNYCSTPIPNAKVYVYETSPVHTAATGLAGCGGSSVSSNVVTPSGSYFCFDGPETKYDIEIFEAGSTSADFKYRWITKTNHTPGIYNITEFGAIGDPYLPTATNNLYYIKSALAFAGSGYETATQGAKIIVPNGIFKVTGDPPNKYYDTSLPMVLPPGTTLEGTNSKPNYSDSRIQMDNPDSGTQMFKIGGCSDKVSVRDLQLLSYSKSGYATGSVGIYASGGNGDSPSNGTLLRGLTVQGFDEAVLVYGADTNHGWQFGSSHIEDSVLSGYADAIHVNSLNAEVTVTNTSLYAGTNSDYSVKGSCVNIERSSLVNLFNVTGGGPAVTPRSHRAKAFLWVHGSGHSAINLHHCESEETDMSILYEYDNTLFDSLRWPLTLDSCTFGDPIILKANVELVSIGNTYYSNTVQVWGSAEGTTHNGNSNATQIYSFGDNFTGFSIPESGDTADTTPRICPGYTSGISSPAETVLTRCRRDFYVYNTTSENNMVVVRNSQRGLSANDSETIDATHFQTPITITSPPIFASGNAYPFQAWGYRIQRNATTGALDFIGNQRSPKFSFGDYVLFSFNGPLLPSSDHAYDLGTSVLRWKNVYAQNFITGDAILGDRETGKQLYRINEDENNIYFSDIRTGKEMMRLDRKGNLYIPGKIIQGAAARPPASPAKVRARSKRRRH